MRTRVVRGIVVIMFLALPTRGVAMGNYSVISKVVEGHTTYHLLDARRKMDLGIVPDIGNFAYEFKVDGKDVLIAPESLKAYLEKHWFGWGIPFLAPYANRIDHDYYYFQDKKYLLNDSLGNLLRVPPANMVLHGLLVFDPHWEVVETGGSDATGAFITSHLEFYKYPDLMAQFPFAHVYDVTYRLKDGKLECTTKVTNAGKSVMPVHFGYHPYFRPDGLREEWTLGIGAQKHWLVNEALIPSGDTEPTDSFLPGATTSLTLGHQFIDAGFADFKRDPQGLGHIWTKGNTEKIEVVYGKEFQYAIVYAPLDHTLICIEPQTGPTNAFNLEHEGKFKGLDALDPGRTFEATYWIIPTGF
ncbi:MAG: aldose 1-epimerase [Terriglobia bacterium]